jgi:hypothetical protein
MINEIKFKKETASKGRNGIIKTSGVEVMSSSYGVMLSPITSKGKPSDACFVEVDIDSVNEVAMSMIKAVNPDYDEKEEAIRLLVEKYGMVRHLWFVDDIRGRAAELKMEVDDVVVSEVAYALASKTDCSTGLTWDTIDYWLEEFTTPTEMMEYDESEDPATDEILLQK